MNMAIEMRTEMRGITKEQAEAFGARMLATLKTAPSFIAHASGPIEDGYYATEFWESREAHERWMQEAIMPAMQQMGGGQPPQAPYLPADNVITR